MISTILELLALAGLVKAASFYTAWAAWLVASLGLAFVGYAIGDSPIDAAAMRHARRSLRAVKRFSGPAPATSSPHPELRIDPDVQAMADRMVAARLRRPTRLDRSPALARHDYNGD